MKEKTIGILGGSFNPVHSGHTMLASYIAQFSGVDEVWLMLSPCNPLKVGREMAPDIMRYEMLTIACGSSALVKPSDRELTMPRPSYTIDTLRRLEAEYPDCRFRLVIGGDNWAIFNRWKSAGEILDRYGVIVYPRPGYRADTVDDPRVTVADAPMIDLSSTFVRESISKGLDMNFFLPQGVYDYILAHHLYSK